MTKPWLRLYRNAIGKPKVGRLSLSDLGFWSACLMLSDDDGMLPSNEDIAWSLRLSDSEASERMATLVTRGLVTRDSHDMSRCRLNDWDEHQHASDGDPTAADRKRRQREREKQLSQNNDLAASRVTVTECHADVTRTDTDTDTDTEEEKNMSVPSAPDGFEQFWKAYPRTPNMSKAAALKAWQKQKSKLPPTEILLQAVAKYRAFLGAETKKNGREYPAKHAQGWLNEERWLGFMGEVQAQDAPTHAADWADDVPQWAKFKASVPPAAWSAFFAGCKPNGSISTLIAPSTFVMEQIESRYGQALDAVFDGQFNVKFEARN